MCQTTRSRKRLSKIKVLGLGLGLAALLLAACMPATSPLQITKVTVSPEPKVGQVFTLHIEIMSTEDEPEVQFAAGFLEEYGNKVHYLSGDTTWTGALVANQPQAFDLTACVLEEGTWPIDIQTGRSAPGAHYAAYDQIHLKSSIDSGMLIRSQDWRGPEKTTPMPRPLTVSPECSGQSR